MIKCVLFDMDGVLIPAKSWHKEALDCALLEFGYEITEKEHLLQFDGLPTRKKLEILTEKKGLPVDLHDKIYQLKQDKTVEMLRTHLVPNEKHIELLKFLCDNKYKIGLCSNSIRKTVFKAMSFAKIYNYFDVILTNEDVTFPKPNPEIYSKAMKRLKVLPHECLILEDNHYGIQAATAARGNILKVAGVDDVSVNSVMKEIIILNRGSAFYV